MKGWGIMGYKKTHEEYIQDLKEKNIKVIPLEEYRGSKIKILHKCTCGAEWSVQPSNVLYGKKCGCTTIQNKINNYAKKYLKTLEEQQIKIKPLEPYQGRFKKIKHKCVCGSEWSITPSDVLGGDYCGCNKGRKPWTHEEYLNKLKEKEINFIPLENYIDNNTKIKHKCILCEKLWDSTPSRIIRKVTSCCSRKEKTWTHAEYLEELEKKNRDVLPLELYINAKTPILHQCSCGNEWKVTPNNILTHDKKCGCEFSKGEIDIKEFLLQNNFSFEREYSFDDLKKSRFDFAIFNINKKVKILIEFNGKQHYEFVPYWHKNQKGFEIQKNRDERKRQYAKVNKIPLIEIPYWENTIEYLEDVLKKGSG